TPPAAHPDRPPCPTRPASELPAAAESLHPHGSQGTVGGTEIGDVRTVAETGDPPRCAAPAGPGQVIGRAVSRRCRTLPRRGRCPDRKSTRLNSSHVSISYAAL